MSQNGYDVTVENEDGIDGASFVSPFAAIEYIQNCRREGYTVQYTGDPFADAAHLAAED